MRLMLKFGVPLVIVFVFLLFSLGVISYLTLRLDLSKIFKTTPQPAPTPATGGLSVKIAGVDGDSAVVGFRFPKSASSSEEILFTGKNLEEIELGLNKIETDRLEGLTNLPSTVFRFNVSLISYPDSPNKAKKASYFLVTDSSGVVQKVFPGESLTFIKNVKIGDLPSILSASDIKLVYENGMYQNFYDTEGNLVSQATGELVVKPTPLVQLLIILGVWAFIIALLALIKQTILSSQDVNAIIDFVKAP